MEIEATGVLDAFKVRPVLHRDERGAFFESFRSGLFTELTGHVFRPCQTNFSVNKEWVLRGLHGVTLPPGQAKYVTCVRGAVMDVVVDCRLGSPTFGEYHTSLLSPEEGTAVFMAAGLAHGFVALADDTCVNYVFDTPYVAGTPFEVNPFDLDLDIPWQRDCPLIVAAKDLEAPSLAEAATRGLLPSYEDCLQYYRSLREAPAEIRKETHAA